MEGAPWKADLVINASPAALHALLFTEEDPAALVKSGQITLEGPASTRKKVWADFLRSFALRG